MERSWIVDASFIPPFDLVSNDGGLFERKPTQQPVHLRSGRRICQSFVCDRTDDFMSKWTVSLRGRRKFNSGENRKC